MDEITKKFTDMFLRIIAKKALKVTSCWVILIKSYSKNVWQRKLLENLENIWCFAISYPPELRMCTLKQISRNCSKFSATKSSCNAAAKCLKILILRLEQNSKISKLFPSKLTHFLVSPSGFSVRQLYCHYWAHI